MKNKATGEYGNTYRTTFKGKSGLDSLSRGVTESINDNEEEKLFSTSKQVDTLIESLLKKVKEDEAQ